MAKEEGVKFTCDRCGKTRFFKSPGDDDKKWFGFERWDDCAAKEEGWVHIIDSGGMWLCPKCAAEYEEMVRLFKYNFDKWKEVKK